ncbi:MAG TPA: hypothetical protein VNQ53_18180, partial [Nocardioides sp.]|nr:hypothetical protein [Nocardioides sp.]
VVRRRLAAGAGAAVAAVVLGSAGFALAGGGPTAEPERGFATTPTESPEAPDQPVDAGGPDRDLEWGPEAAYLGTDGVLRTKPGWTIAERIDAPVGPGSVAVEVARDGRLQWFLWDGKGGEVVALGRPHSEGVPDSDYTSFHGWLTEVSNAASLPHGEGRR